MSRGITAVVPAAGLGRRTGDLARLLPKEMLPLGRTTAIQEILAEAASVGASEIIVVTRSDKPLLRNHCEDIARLEGFDPRLTFVEQRAPTGLGDAVALAARAASYETLAVLLGDCVMDSPRLLDEMVKLHERSGVAVLAVKPIARDEIDRYGVVLVDEATPGGNLVTALHEKQLSHGSPHRPLGLIGRYVLPRQISEFVARHAPWPAEVGLTEALNAMCLAVPTIAMTSREPYDDVGTTEGWIRALARRMCVDDDVEVHLRTMLAAIATSEKGSPSA